MKIEFDGVKISIDCVTKDPQLKAYEMVRFAGFLQTACANSEKVCTEQAIKSRVKGETELADYYTQKAAEYQNFFWELEKVVKKFLK